MKDMLLSISDSEIHCRVIVQERFVEERIIFLVPSLFYFVCGLWPHITSCWLIIFLFLRWPQREKFLNHQGCAYVDARVSSVMLTYLENWSKKNHIRSAKTDWGNVIILGSLAKTKRSKDSRSAPSIHPRDIPLYFPLCWFSLSLNCGRDKLLCVC